MMGDDNNLKGIKKATVSGIAFKLFERISINLVGFVISVILARLLEPEVVGVVALAETVILFFSIVATYGFGNSLIQNRNMTEVDASTAFFSSLMLASMLYIGVFFAAPFVEGYYGYEKYDFALVIRILGISLIPTSIKSIEQALVAKQMKFKFFLYTSLLTSILSGVVGISMAYKGFGVWAIVGQFMTSETVSALALGIMLGWTPVMRFSLNSLRHILGFGWKLILYGIVNVFYMQIRSLVIAKKYSSSDLAFYNRGLKLSQLVPENLSEALMAVLFPAFSNYAHKDRMLSSMRRSIKSAALITVPLMVGLFAVADNLIVVLLTEKWSDSIIYLRILSVSYLFYPIEQIEEQSIKALGKSGALLALNLVKKGIAVVLLLLTFSKGVEMIAYGFLISMFINFIISVYVSKRYFDYGVILQIRDIIKELSAAVIMVICCMSVNKLGLSPILSLMIQVIAGGLVYIGVIIVLKAESYAYMKNAIKAYAKQRKPEDQ